MESHILQAQLKQTLGKMKSAESDLSTSYSFNIKSFSPVISLIVQMKMSSGTEILNKIISFQHQACWVTNTVRIHLSLRVVA